MHEISIDIHNMDPSSMPTLPDQLFDSTFIFFKAVTRKLFVIKRVLVRVVTSNGTLGTHW